MKGIDKYPVTQKKKKKKKKSKQARRKAKKVKRQTNKQQSGLQQAAPPQSAKLAGSEPIVEQQGVVPDEEPLLEADFPLPGSLKLPTLMGSHAALARLQPAPRSDAGGLGDATPLASSSHAGVPEAASPLAGKRRGPDSLLGSESSEIAEAPAFFFFFLGGKDIHYTSAMIVTSRVCDVHHKPERPKLTTHLELFRHES